MKKMIVAVLVVVVLFALALAQPAVAPKKVNPPKELGTLTLTGDLDAVVTGIEDLKCNKQPSGTYQEGVMITLNDRGVARELADILPETNGKPWNDFEGDQGLGVVIIKTNLRHLGLDNSLRFVFHFYLEEELVFPDSNKPGQAGPPWFSLGFIAERAYDQGKCTLALAQQTVDATIKENARVVVWSGLLKLTLELVGG